VIYIKRSKIMKLTAQQLRRIIQEVIAPDPKGALAAAKEMGYDLGQRPTMYSNEIAINDALGGYPREFTYEDIIAAVKASGGTV
jgi:hypothetical protein